MCALNLHNFKLFFEKGETFCLFFQVFDDVSEKKMWQGIGTCERGRQVEVEVGIR